MPHPNHAVRQRRAAFVGLPVALVTAAAAIAVLPAHATQAEQTRTAPSAATSTPTSVPRGMIGAEEFADPGAAYGPGTRWWWGSLIGMPSGSLDVDNTRQQLRAIDDAGFDRVEIAYSGDKWATPEQRENFEVALDEAASLGMQVDTTLGAAWPLKTPNTSAGTGLSLQELQYGRVDVDGGTTYVGPVPTPFDDAANERGATLVAATAARVVTRGPAVHEVDVPPASSTVLDPESLVDLTAEVVDGSLEWEAPPGDWIVFGFWQREAAEDVHDHFNKAAIRSAVRYVRDEQFSAEGLDRFGESGYSFFEDSLELDAEGVFWTGDMLTEFRQRRGYDATSLLPLFFQQGMSRYWVPEDRPVGDFDLPEGEGERIRNDYYELLTDLYVDEHLAPLVDETARLGGRFRTQAAFGQNLDVTRSARELAQLGGMVDDESLNAGDGVPWDLEGNAATWRFAFDHHRSVTSGAHQGGSTEISSELGAILGASHVMNLGDYKGIMDKEWAAGTTRPLIHGTSYQTSTAQWPGDAAFGPYVTESWNADSFPQWQDWKPLTDYWSRGTLVLQTGTPRTDVAVYQDEFITTAAEGFGGPAAREPLFDALSMEERGYSIGFIDPNGLIEPQADGRGVLYPSGPGYRTLVVDERALPGDVARRLASEAAQGLHIVLVGELPSRGTGYADSTREDAQVVAAVERMMAQSTVTRVDTQDEVGAAIAGFGVRPAAAWSTPTQVYTQRRTTAAGAYYYLYNATDETVSIDGSFTGHGTPYAYDLWSGKIAPMPVHRQRAGRTIVPVELEPHGTAVIAIADAMPRTGLQRTTADDATTLADGRIQLRATRRGKVTYVTATGRRGTAMIPSSPRRITLDDWHLSVDEWGPDGVSEVFDDDLDDLMAWRDIPALEDISGVGTYTGVVRLPKAWNDRRHGAYLDLGDAAGSIRVWVNGKRIAPDTVASRAWDLGTRLDPGRNTVTVRVSTTLRNVVTAEIGAPIGPPSQDYGLLGPVRISPFGKVAIRPAR